MIRDRGPISSLGFGVTSRDIPVREGETEGPSPNSGIVAKALNGHPVMRFFAASGATMAGSIIASKFVKAGGVRLAKYIQTAADGTGEFAGAATRFVESAGKIKKALDELEGVTRSIEGVDPTDVYSKLVFEIDGRAAKQNLTRLQGGLFTLEGNSYLTTRELKQASAGITREPPAVWSFRDDIQQTLVKRARNLAIELPALYMTQRAVTDPLFGTNQDQKKVKWYNPVDVIADFSKQSAINMASMLTPFDLGGAAISRVKFLAAAPTAKNPNLRLTARQTKYSNAILDVKTILGELGQDVEKVIGGLTRNTTSMAAAFSTAVKEGGAAEGGVVFAMQQARRGAAAAGQAYAAGGAGNTNKLRVAATKTKAYLFGHQISNPNDPDFGTRLQGLADAVPSLKGVTSGVAEFRTRFRSARTAYDVVNGAISYDEALRSVGGSPSSTARIPNAKEALASSIKQIRSMHSSIFSDFSKSILEQMGPSAINGGTLSSGQFAKHIETEEYVTNLKRHLIEQGVSESTASKFTKKVGLDSIPTSFNARENISQRMTFGQTKIVSTDTKDFFEQLIRRTAELEKVADPTFTIEALENSVLLTDVLFANKNFQQRLQNKITRSWTAFYDEVALPKGQQILRSQKALYKDFEGEISGEKADYLARTAADALGMDLLDEHGQRVSSAVLKDGLARRGIDISNIGQLKAFLIQEKRMTSSIFPEGYNILGLKPLLIDEAFNSGVFGYLSDEEKGVIEGLAGEIARKDPISSTIGYSELKGVYQTRSGNIIDTTRIRRAGVGLLNFVRDQTQIPIIKFNPLDMIGYGGAQGIDERNMFGIARGNSFQPFGQLDSTDARLFVFSQEKRGFFGPTGSIYTIDINQQPGSSVRKLEGKYKQFATNENDMFSKTARIAAGRQIIKNSPIQPDSDDGTTLDKIKRRMDIAEEQPNSLFRYFQRFRRRKQDIYNPTVFAKLLSDEQIETGRGSRISLRRDNRGEFVGVFDEADNEVYGHSEVLRAYESFRRSVQTYGTPQAVIREFERKDKGFLRNILPGSTAEVALSDVRSEAELREFAVAEIERAGQTARALSSSRSTIDTRSLTAAQGIVRSKLEAFNLEEVSPRAVSSPTISTRVDELREAILQLALQRRSFDQSAQSGAFNAGQLAIDIETIISDLQRRKIISSNQATEARAAGLSTVLNFTAFSGYKRDATEGQNLAKALSGLIGLRQDQSSSPALRGLLQPFVTQKIANVGTAGPGNDIISMFRPFVTRTLKPSQYRLKETAANELGNQGTVFIPTFSTVAQSVGPMRAVKSALGFTTYDDMQAFSAAGVPIAHSVQRLNKYFETFGIGLDESNYSGPLGLYTQRNVNEESSSTGCWWNGTSNCR